LGIALGSWWAYYELGWGGWWFWDPVENASLMPWLVGTALIHSLAVTEKRGVFRAWTVLLAIAAFSLSLLGTFLVRSGVLTSVHAFANDPKRGLFILAILGLLTGGALSLLVFRAAAIRSEGRFEPVSRETLLLSNNLLLVGACGVVFTGTLFPLLADILNWGKMSVGPPYFNTLFVPLALALLLVLGIGPLLHWKHHDLHKLLPRLVPLAALSLGLGLGLPLLATGELHFWVVLSLSLVFWVLLTSLYDIKARLTRKNAFLAALISLPRSYKGMVLAHLGVAVCVTGVTITSVYSIERDIRLQVQETLTVGPYDFRLLSLREVEGPNYRATQAKVEVLRKDGTVMAVMEPEKRLYTVQQMPMTEVAIEPGLTRDLYLALGEPLADGAWAMRIYYKPFVRWIWLGALCMALGGVLAISDPRYRLAWKQRRADRTVTVTGKPYVAKA
jgi:cytochrome c-type biogenesis protein CcmF